jgi:hypothetical protein
LANWGKTVCRTPALRFLSILKYRLVLRSFRLAIGLFRLDLLNNLTNIQGMTIHTLLTALADAEKMYKKVGMAGLAENAANAYKVILASIRDSRWTKC